MNKFDPVLDSPQQPAQPSRAGVVHFIDDDASFLTAMERRPVTGRNLCFGGTFSGGEHFLDRLPSENVPNCILLDVLIPGLSGPQLQMRWKELGSTLPIIFLSGHPDIATTVRAIKAGAEDVSDQAGDVRQPASRH